MDEYHYKVELHKEIDALKEHIAKINKPVLLREDQWDSLTPASHNFLADINSRLLDERRRVEVNATIRGKNGGEDGTLDVAAD